MNNPKGMEQCKSWRHHHIYSYHFASAAPVECHLIVGSISADENSHCIVDCCRTRTARLRTFRLRRMLTVPSRRPWNRTSAICLVTIRYTRPKYINCFWTWCQKPKMGHTLYFNTSPYISEIISKKVNFKLVWALSNPFRSLDIHIEKNSPQNYSS